MTSDLLKKIGTRLGDIDDLPEELKKQIPEFALGGLDEQVYTVLKEDLDGVASLSEIIVALYQRFKVYDKTRAEITDAIYRLIRKKVVQGVKGRKAVYMLTSLKVDNIEEGESSEDSSIDTISF